MSSPPKYEHMPDFQPPTEDDFDFLTEQVNEFRVTVQSKKDAKAQQIGSLITVHDIGLNQSSFQTFFYNKDNVQFFNKFTVYHVELPGQHKGAEKFEDGYQFPSLPRIGDRLIAVIEHFKLHDLIGIGVGAGAIILIHLAMSAPDKFTGITVIDPAGKSVGFKEWGEQKLASYSLEKKGFTTGTDKFLIWHLFGTKGKEQVKGDIVENCMKGIKADQNPHNLSHYVKAYMNRPDIMQEVQGKLLCHVLIITSAFSPYKDEAYSFFSKLDRKKSSILESFETINAFFEDPGKCGEGMLLLMQGCGMAPTLKTRTTIRAGPVHRTASMSEDF